MVDSVQRVDAGHVRVTQFTRDGNVISRGDCGDDFYLAWVFRVQELMIDRVFFIIDMYVFVILVILDNALDNVFDPL